MCHNHLRVANNGNEVRKKIKITKLPFATIVAILRLDSLTMCPTSSYSQLAFTARTWRSWRLWASIVALMMLFQLIIAIIVILLGLAVRALATTVAHISWRYQIDAVTIATLLTVFATATDHFAFVIVILDNWWIIQQTQSGFVVMIAGQHVRVILEKEARVLVCCTFENDC